MTTDTTARAAIPQDATAATDRDGWLALIDAIGEEAGYFEPLGKRHWAFFADESPTLLVTFETLDAIRMGSPTQMPMGYPIATARGWSHLCLIADGPTWWRDQSVYRYFDRLVDDAFFEDFDRVVFYGAGAGGYAACAYSVCAPGATVLAVQPRATLDPAIAGWDRRHLAHRRLNFTDRYGYAPDMIEGAGEVFLTFDPRQHDDAMHAALFARPYVTALRCPHLGERVDVALGQMRVLQPLIEAACEGHLTPAVFAQAWRSRRNFGPYLKQLLAVTEASGNLGRAETICRNVTTRLNAPRFRKRLAQFETQAKA
ncbi:MAG: phosphoadenosine phosphosulfate reductase [Paracoccaceae bacterium]|nr:phosphoadenosine phosphosulfate reductase [Paracoccaceae bacterium]